MTSIRRITAATVTAVFTGIAIVAGASSAFAMYAPDGSTGSSSTTTEPAATGGGTSTLTYVLVAVAAVAFVALVLMTARTLRAHTRRSHVVRHA